MELLTFAIRDNQLNVYGRPFFEKTEVEAMRGLSIALADKTLQLSFFPKHFDLYKIGKFDDISGKITPIEPVFVTSAVSLLELEQAIKKEQKNG